MLPHPPRPVPLAVEDLGVQLVVPCRENLAQRPRRRGPRLGPAFERRVLAPLVRRRDEGLDVVQEHPM